MHDNLMCDCGSISKYFSWIPQLLPYSIKVLKFVKLLRSMLARSFAHIVSETPLPAIINDAKKV